jgi:uncharacterized membrane protein YeaQ/YmgE (transglycosylase-associated protein family)
MSTIVFYILIGTIIGSIFGILMKNNIVLHVGNVVTGVVGAVLGGLIFDLIKESSNPVILSALVSMISAIIILTLLHMFLSEDFFQRDKDNGSDQTDGKNYF